MTIKVLTLFPNMFESVLGESILRRAIDAEHLTVECIDIRTFSKDKHHRADDYPFGGGAGMVMTAQPIADAIKSATAPPFTGRRIYLSPRGALFTQKKAAELAQHTELLLLCGHYEGVDQRVLDACIDEELSIGDYVLTGGELAAMVVIDAVARLIPGVLGSSESAVDESHSAGWLEYPQFTRPAIWEDREVPAVLLSGHHAQIDQWRREQAIETTLRNRPDLLPNLSVSEKERNLIERFRRSPDRNTP